MKKSSEAVWLEVTRWHNFLQARVSEEGTNFFAEALGFAYGYAQAMIDVDRPGFALPKLRWMVKEAKRWSAHPDYPGKENSGD